MYPEQVATVRAFHRLVTQRAGALEDRFLGRDRPLGQSRVLYEVGRAGASLRDLRIRLGLDSGYLSRLVQALGAAGLVEVTPSRADERVRRVRLTASGLAELDEINRRSDETAESILAAVDESQRTKLVEAMATVTRLLRSAAVRFERTDPTSPEAAWCLERYFEELDARFEEGFDTSLSLVTGADGCRPPAGAFLVATVDGRPVACGGLKVVGGDTAYLKRMWVDGTVRGLGLGRRLLDALEREARSLGCRRVQLETNRALTEAIRLYETSGYRRVDAFNDELYADHWFEKELSASVPGPEERP
jgi:DNA-binding MarR family transcriptional regulator/N-acetylglutamate synthase-like GNAT family acetyltransferase